MRTFSLRQRSILLEGDGSKGPYRLPDGFLLRGAERVWVGGELRERGKDYSIDYGRGEVRFFDPVLRGETIRVEYERLPIDLKPLYSHRELVRSDFTSLRGNKTIKEPPLPSPLSLQIRGSKSFELNLGTNKDLTFNQSLRLNITGKLTPEISLLANLTDENVPLQASGTTQNLSALDRLMIEVRGPKLSASLGDFNLAPGEGKYSPPGRKLRGVRVDGNLASSHFILAGALSRGKFMTNRFLGEEGKQGPYRLTGRWGEGRISILAGTDRVWLDGIPLERGEGYTIDYQEATLSFTPKRVITSQSVIVVEFQYTLKDYQRSFYIGQGRWNLWEGRLRFFSSLYRESDDGEDPLSFPLGEREKEVLRRVGDKPDSAWVDGAKFMGKGEGEYIQAVDSLGNPYFLWVGPDSGSYQVNFSWVGEGKGSYIKTEEGNYRYVYPGGGNYSPRVFLPLPQSHLLSNCGFEAQPDSTIRFGGEVALSQEDRNLFSPYDDGDNLGRATILFGKLKLNRFLGKTLPSLGIKGSYEDRQPNFSPLRGDEEKDYRGEWGLDPTPLDQLLRAWELSGYFSPLRGLTISSERGWLETKEGLGSWRRRYGGRFQGFKILQLRYSRQLTKTSAPTALQRGELIKDEAKGNISLGKTSVGLGYLRRKGERGETDFRIEERSASLCYKGWRSLLISSDLLIRAVHSPQYPDEPKGVSRILHTQVKIEEWRNWRGSLSYSRRIGPGQEARQDLARLELGYHREGWAGEFRYQANRIYSSNLLRTYLKVGEGEGDFRKEGDDWIPDEEGNYVMVTEEAGGEHPSSRLDGDLTLTAEPKTFLRSQTQIRWEEERKEKGEVLPSLRLKGEYGQLSLLEELELFPYSPRGFLTLKYSLNKLKEGRFGQGVEEETENKKGISLLYNLTPDLSLNLNLSRGIRRRAVGGLSQYDIILYQFGLGNSFRLNQGFTLSLSGGYEWDKNFTSGVRAELFSLAPKAVKSFLEKGKVELGVGWNRVVQSPKGVPLSWAMVEGEKPGDTIGWSVALSYKLSSLLTAELNYQAKSDPLWGWRRRGRMEVRALF